MPSKIVIGKEPWLSMALEDWKLAEPLTVLVPFEIKLDQNYLIDFPNLDAFSPSEVTGFVAWGPEFLNFQRYELFGEFKKKGFKLPALIHSTAQVSPSAILHENVWVQAMTYIGSKTLIEPNCNISLGVSIASGVTIRRNSWIGQRTTIGHSVKIGSNTVLNSEINVFSNIEIGRQVFIDTPLTINKNINDKYFHLQKNNLQSQIIKY